MAQRHQTYWLDGYANDSHAWELETSPNARQSFKRRLGLVETSFDADGSYYGGRADLTLTLKLEVRHEIPQQELRRRIALAWTLLRLRHVLLMSRVGDEQGTGKRCFIIDIPSSVDDATEAASQSITWLEDFGYSPNLDVNDLHHHALNVGRIIQSAECLSKLHVLPPRRLAGGTWDWTFLIVMAHQIADGLSVYAWVGDLLRILNLPAPAILDDVAAGVQANRIKERLPPAQEDLYPKVVGNRARQRWFWAIIRVLRHVEKPMPPTFVNPLRRETRLQKAIALQPTFERIFDYSEHNRPPMSTGHIIVALSPASSARMIALCRSAHVSIGAGCFALVGLSMMQIHEARYRETSSEKCASFGASFPLDPRAFFGVKTEANSCMLAFSEGIVMPFLPSSLPIEGRFKLVAKHANRELRAYQKRLKAANGNANLSAVDKCSPSRLLATGYLSLMDWVDAKLPEDNRIGANPQGELRPRVGKYGATCGVSSVGSMSAFFKPGVYDLVNVDKKDFAADYREVRIGVRARDNEFLIGSATDGYGRVAFSVSYDLNAISQEAAEMWANMISELLDKGDGSRL